MRVKYQIAIINIMINYLFAFCLILCWGVPFLASKNIVAVLPPYWGTFLIVLTGLLFFIILFTLQRAKLSCPLKELWRPWVIGFLLILLPFTARSWGLQYTDPTIGGIVNGSVPIWSFLAGAVLLKGQDRFTWRRALGVTIGLLGLLVSKDIGSLSVTTLSLLGYAALLLMALSYGVGNVITKKIMVDSTAVSWQANTLHQYLFSAAVLGIIALSVEPTPHLQVFDTKLVLSILIAGVFSSAVAFLLMLALLKRWGATRMASLTYFTPVIAMLTDIIFRARTPLMRELAGLFFIFISLWLIQKQVKN